MIRTLFVAAAALALGACGELGTKAALDIPDVANGDLSVDTMKEAVRTLSSDEFEGRMPGSQGEERTVAYLARKFESVGLKPGNNGSWVQGVPLVEITGRDYAPLRISGGKTDLALAHGKDWVGVSFREVAETRIDASEMVFVGYGINAPERGWNDYDGVDVKGKTVVILINDPDYRSETQEGDFNGRAMTYYGRWTYKFEEAARQGAAAALIVHDTEPASYGWNVVESSWSGPQAFAQRGDNAPPLTGMNGWVSNAAARKILEAAGQDLDRLTALAQTRGFKAVPLALAASTSLQNDIRTYNSKNVIGILPGSEAPQEYVIYTAHWDHLGHCTPAPDGDDICNGAIDNATGTAALIALAEANAKAGAPRRSMVFLAVTAEEQGLLGSEYYASNPVYPLARTVGGVNMDALTMDSLAKDVSVIGGGKSQLDQYLAAALKANGRAQTPDPNSQAGYYYRSDHFSLAKRGVPMFNLKPGLDLVEGGREAGQATEADYRANRYHGPKDEYDENWDWSRAMADLQLYYQLGRMLAMSDSWPNWHEGDEFRAVRDKSCAAAAAGC